MKNSFYFKYKKNVYVLIVAKIGPRYNYLIHHNNKDIIVRNTIFYNKHISWYIKICILNIRQPR